MTTHTLPVPRARYAAPLTVVFILVVTGIITEVADPETAGAIGTLGMIAGHGTAGILMYRRAATLPDAERRAFRLMAIALMVIAASLVAFAVTLPSEPPVFGLVDVAFFASYAMVIVAVVMLARMHRSGPPWGLTMLDSTVAAVAASALIWDLVLSDLITHPDVGTERFGLAMYPILDVGLIVGLCLVAIRRAGFRFDPRLLLLAAAMTTQVIADILLLRDGLAASTFTDANPHFGFFLATPALAIAAASIVDRTADIRPVGEREVLPVWSMVWPYVLAGALVPLHVIKVEELHDAAEAGALEPGQVVDDRVVLYALLAVGVLILLRQLAAIHYNRVRVERQRRDLISSVSHELRTPLTAIFGFLEILREDDGQFSPQERQTMLADAAAQTRQMSRTMTDIITLARDGGASMTIHPRVVALGDVVRAAVVDDGIGLNLTTDIDDHLLRVDGDRLQQAIAHLLANARAYGGARVHVRATVRGGMASIEVHDDGPGVSPRFMDTIWDQFDRGPRRLDSASPGLGLGLAIVRAVARAHGGRADYLTSDLLGGACFRITIPAPAASVGSDR